MRAQAGQNKPACDAGDRAGFFVGLKEARNLVASQAVPKSYSGCPQAITAVLCIRPVFSGKQAWTAPLW
jgi:hypothetical protein